MRCPNCNYPVLSKFKECPKCGTPLGAPAPAHSDFDFDAPAPAPKPAAGGFDFDAPAPAPRVAQPVDGVSIISGKAVWSLAPGQIARRVTEREMADCGAVKGVVIQDGVTAAVFSDGKLIHAIEGGLYRFSDEVVKRDGKREIVTPQGKVKPAPAADKPETKKSGLFGFVGRLFGLKKEKPASPATNPNTKPAAPASKPGSPANPASPKPAPKAPAPQAVVTVYLISNRVFEEVFGSICNSGEYQPLRLEADSHPVELGVSMQLRVSDFDTFRQQYLVDSDEVTVDSLRRMMTPWVTQIAQHTLDTIGFNGDTLTPQQQLLITDNIGSMLQSRLFGLSVLNVFDLATTSADFDALRQRERKLWQAEKDSEIDRRENEFRNRLAEYELQQAADRTRLENDFSLSHDKEMARYEQELRELNKDNLISEDKVKQLVAQHEMEMRLADVARNADEQTRKYESQKLLDQLESQKLIDADERAAIQTRVETGAFERGQLNDVMRHRALVKTTVEKLDLDTDLAMRESKAKHQLDLNDLSQETERTEAESLLYGKRYALDRQRTENELELKSIALDADIENRRKEDAYAEEKYRRDRQHSHDEWEEKFMRESREMERSRENRKADADFDFDVRKRNEEFDFDMTAKKAEFDFDLDDRRQDKDVERTIKLDEHGQNMADREHQRKLEEERLRQEALRTKGDIAMRNMQMMMEAKRAAKKDELDAATDQLNIKSQMTAEQIAAEQLRHLDASAQSGFMDALREEKSSAKEAEMARREAEMTRQMHEQMMGRSDQMHEQNRNDLKEMMAQMMQMQQMSQQQAMDLARHSMDTSANIAASQAASNASAAERRAADLERDNERYREDARHSQSRIDATQTQSLDYTTRVTMNDADNGVAPSPGMKSGYQQPSQAPAATPQPEPATIPLNTAWLRDHGFAGSFNELAGALSSLGAEISKDFDADGNPIIVVDGLPEGQVFDILTNFGVEF